MGKLPTWLRKLDAALEALCDPADPMTLSQLDGYLAGILVCPELILPGEWMPLVWNQNPDAEFVFDDEKQVRDAVELVMKLYNTISRNLQRGDDHYDPIFDVHSETGEMVPVLWLIGFSQAMSLRPESWLQIAESEDEDATTALAILLALASDGEADAEMPEDELEELFDLAPDMIPHCIQHLNDWRLRNYHQPGSASPKVGRNDPCPCGSGKKYKKCCGLN